MRRVAAFGVLLVLIAAVVYGRRENTILRLLWPPSDLYSTLAEVPLNIAARGESALLTFAPKYGGKHAVELHFPGKLTFDAAGDTPLVLEVRVAVEPKGEWRETTGKLASGLYMGRSGSGFILFWASGDRRWVPGEETQVAVTVIEPDIRLQEIYGPATIRVAKLSDK